MTKQREVVITGVGLVTPIGIGVPAFWEALERGASGVASLTLFDASALPVPFGAEIKGFDGREYVTPRKSLKVMSREIQKGFAAARLALGEARLDAQAVAPDRIGVVYGADMLYCELQDAMEAFRSTMIGEEFQMRLWGERALSRLYPLWMLMYLPNMAACHLAIAYDARGPNNTISVGEASSLVALIEAVRVLQRGQADVMIAGGTSTRLNVTQMLYRGDSNLSHRLADPVAASRPFDAQRDGMVNGEGAGALVLEIREHAEARGAPILARLLGGAMSFGRANDEQAAAQAYRRVIEGALAEGRLNPSEVGHVNAHGVSTPEDDRAEAKAIRATLRDVPVTAPKSLFGNIGAAGGIVELAASILALQHGRVPFTLNYEYPDPDCPVEVVRDRPLAGRPPTALALSRSGTGQTAGVLLAAG